MICKQTTPLHILYFDQLIRIYKNVQSSLYRGRTVYMYKTIYTSKAIYMSGTICMPRLIYMSRTIYISRKPCTFTA